MGKRPPGIPVGIDTGGKVATKGPTACDRCGERIEQSGTGRRRLYCGRNCRELAYRARSRDAAIREALKAAGVDPDAVSSTDVQAIPVTSVDESRVPEPRRGPWKASRRVAQGFKEALSREP
jgi:hypothetical protein